MYRYDECLCRFENMALMRGFKKIAGVDEAGRGALAGPVVAACVILDPDAIPEGITDSKKISVKRRIELCDQIRSTAMAVGVGEVDPGIIDEINVYNATRVAMKTAIFNMGVLPDFLLIDAVKLHDISISCLPLKKLDERSVSVAAASIVAKVHRDSIMMGVSERYPQYGFSAHKGYATLFHMEALKKYGPLKIHRFSFTPVSETYRSWKLKNHT